MAGKRQLINGDDQPGSPQQCLAKIGWPQLASLGGGACRHSQRLWTRRGRWTSCYWSGRDNQCRPVRQPLQRQWFAASLRGTLLRKRQPQRWALLRSRVRTRAGGWQAV